MEIASIQYLDSEGILLDTPDFCPTQEELIRMYQVMWMTRLFDERMIILQRQGAITFSMSSLGEEAASVATTAALALDDWIYPQYREIGAIFYRGSTLQEQIHHMFGNAKDPIKGRQMPNHFGSRKLNIVTVSSPIGTKLTHVSGAAYAMKVQREPTVALCYFGEGAASEGDFHAGLNFSSVKRVPAIYFCRNNHYAISTKTCDQFGGGVAEKGPGYGIVSIKVDGNDVFALYHVTKLAKELCLKGEGPVLIEAMTYRMGAHSTSDDPSVYRTEEEVEKWRSRCPIKRLRAYLEKEEIWDEKREKALKENIYNEITEAIEEAKRVPPPPLRSLIEEVYSEVPASLEQELQKGNPIGNL